MRRTLTILLGLGALLPPFEAEADSCSGLEAVTPEVEVTADPGGDPPVEAAPAEAIRERAAATGRHLGDDRVIGGLTTATIHGEVGYTLTKVERPRSGAACVTLQSVTARIAARDVKVLVDRRYAEGSCQWRAILDHEREHVRINGEAVESGAPQLRRRLRAVAARWQGRWVPEKEGSKIGDALQAALRETVADVQRGADSRHAEIDSPRSYAEVQRRCRGW